MSLLRILIVGVILFIETNTFVSAQTVSTDGNALNIEKIIEIRTLLRSASDGTNKNVQYVVSGDSTRQCNFCHLVPAYWDNSYNSSDYYYLSQFSKIGVKVGANARSGQRANKWAHNIDSPNVDEAIAMTAGDGVNTIMELSLGINDYSANKNSHDNNYIKERLRLGINKYLEMKPRAHILIVTPVPTTWIDRIKYNKAYKDIAEEFDLPMIYSHPPLSDNKNGPNLNLYHDHTHPDAHGLRLLVDYLFGYLMDQKTAEKMGVNSVSLGGNVSCSQSHLNLCTTQSTCTTANGNWCNNQCQSNSCTGGTVIRADVNQDSEITTTDALLVLRKSTDYLLTSLEEMGWHTSTTTGDVNCDGEVRLNDAVLLLKKAVGGYSQEELAEMGWCEDN